MKYKVIFKDGHTGIETNIMAEAIDFCKFCREQGDTCAAFAIETSYITVDSDYTTPDGTERHKGDVISYEYKRMIY